MRVLIALAAALLTQNAAPPAQPTFRAGVELVRLDVQVTDDDGRPLKDLRQDEIEIVENGERRPVVLFQHIEEPDEPPIEVARHTIAGEVSTNHGAARGHLYVIVFDQQHLAPGNEQRARQAARRFVQTRIRPGDRVALHALPGPGPQIGFTADVRRIGNALDQIHGTAETNVMSALGGMTRQEAFELLRGNELILQRVADRAQAQNGTDAQRRVDPSSFTTGTMPLTTLVKEDARRIANTADGEARTSLARLADLLRPLRTVEGRKSILLISEGFNGDRLAREIEGVAAAAAESYSVVYALDVNRREIDVTMTDPFGADQASAIHDRIAPLGSLAAETGGALLLDAGQRADDVFAGLADRSQDYYLVGFVPASEALQNRGEYRRVAVRVRRDRARVSTRTGFSMSDASARMDRHQAIERALAAPFAQQGLPLRYTTYVLRGSAPGVQSVIFVLDADLPAESSNERSSADVVFVVRSAADGRIAASGHDAIALPQRGDAGGVATGTFRVQFELPAGDYLMRAVVREPGGLVGTADRRFTVRALDGPALESGDLILSGARGELPVRPAAYTGDGLSGVVELYARTIEQLRDARVAIDLVPAGESTAVASGAAELLPVRATARGVTREARLDLPLQSIAPGAYVARARVMVGADTVSQSVREIDVRLGQRSAAAEPSEIASFNPQAVAGGAIARDLVTRLERASSPVAGDTRRGVEQLAAGNFAVAVAAFDNVLAKEPGSGGAAFLLGWALHGAGQDRLAISAWRRAAFLEPTLVPAHLALADIYVHLAQPALAVQALRAGLDALPQSPELRDRLSRIEARYR
jgi:VWFA-related protein